MTGRTRVVTSRARLCAIAGALLLLGCSSPATPIDWKQIEASGRAVKTPAGMGVIMGQGQFRWSDGTVPLQVVPIKSTLARGMRLSTWLTGAQGNRTRFLLDTGSVGTLIGARSPIASEAMISRMRVNAVGPAGATGYMGHLPEVHMGPLTGRDVAVAVVTDSKIPEVERNIVGIVHLFHTQIEHLEGRLTLRNGADRRPKTEAGWQVVPFEPGTPVVRVLDPNGQLRMALVDTGAFTTHAVAGAPKGAWVLPGPDGGAVHQFEVRKSSGRAGVMGGHRFELVIGMDLLASRDWRMTFDEATWAFAPPR